MASRSVVSQLEHVPTKDAGDPAPSLRPPSMPQPSEWPDRTPQAIPMSSLATPESEHSLAQDEASATTKGDPMTGRPSRIQGTPYGEASVYGVFDQRTEQLPLGIRAPLTEDGSVRSRVNVPIIIGTAALIVVIAVLALTSWAPRWVIWIMALVYIAASLGALSLSSRQFRNAVFPHRR